MISKKQLEVIKNMDMFLKEIKIIFPDFFSEWNINELPYLFMGDFVCYVEKKGDIIDMKNVDYILNLFLDSSINGKDLNNIVIVGFLEVLQDNEILYQRLKNCAGGKLKKIIQTYM